MRMQRSIEEKLQRGLSPARLEVLNESGMHAVEPGSETHFRVRIVSSAFEDRSSLERHRMVYELLEQERREGVHALGIETLTPAEYDEKDGLVIESPPCVGGDATVSGS